MKQTLNTLLKDSFVLVFNKEKLDVVKTAEALMEAGFNQMEVTCRVSEPLKKIERLKKELPEFGCGAASLIDFDATRDVYNNANADDPLPSVDDTVNAGADFLVSAGAFSEKTYAKYKSRLPIIPGCGTVSEMLNQFELGATCCKLFPASVIGGPKYIKSVDAALHKIISIIPTGGTNCTNIPQYIEAGVLILGGSFSAIDKAKMQQIQEQQDYDLLASELKSINQLISDCRCDTWPDLDFGNATVDEISQKTGRLFNTK